MSLLIKVFLLFYFPHSESFHQFPILFFLSSSFQIGNQIIKKWHPQQAVQLKVPFVEDLLVIGTASSYIYNLFQKRANFGKELSEYSP